MNKMIAAAAISIAAVLPFAATSALAETVDTQTQLCAEAPAKAAKAGIDCTATSATSRDEDAAAKTYPAGPVHFSSGIVF